MRGRLTDWIPAALQMLVIFGLSSIPNLTELPGGMSDKTAHFAGYAILAALVLRAMARVEWEGVRPGAAWRAWAVSAVYGMTDEFHQRFVPGRTSAVDDWVADACGAAAAVLIISVAAAGRRLEQATDDL